MPRYVIYEQNALRAEIERLKDEAHYNKGACELAMKHRDEAEAEVERLKAALRCSSDERLRALQLHWEHQCGLLEAEVERLRAHLDNLLVPLRKALDKHSTLDLPIVRALITQAEQARKNESS